MINKRIGIIGGGSWATGLASLIASNVKEFNWYIYEKNIIDHLKAHHHNPTYLSSIRFDPSRINFSSKIKETVESSDVIVMVAPSIYVKDLFGKQKIDFSNRFIINASKGIIAGDNISITEYFTKEFGVKASHTGIISGPSHAEEIAMERMTYLTCAAHTDAYAEMIAGLIKQRFVKTILSNDILGVEYGGVLKNVYALAAGIAHGLGYGDNFTAVLVCNAIREMERFLGKVFNHERHLFHSAYLGDLLVTAYSQFSRNRTFGTMIGKGYTVKSAMMEMNQIAEGYYGTRCVFEINESLNAKMPIAKAVYDILYNGANASETFQQLALKLK